MIRLLQIIMTTGLSGWLLLVPASAKAHVLQADGDIGAIMHIYPDDNPITGKPVEYILSFQDVTKRFSLHDCECRVAYVIDERTVGEEALSVNTPTDSLNVFTFPEAAVYQIKISGKPSGSSNFQPFSFAYTVRVASGDIQAQQMPATLWVGIAGAIGMVLLAAYTMDEKNESEKESK